MIKTVNGSGGGGAECLLQGGGTKGRTRASVGAKEVGRLDGRG